MKEVQILGPEKPRESLSEHLKAPFLVTLPFNHCALDTF